MEEAYKQFADAFAKAVVAKDYHTAHSMLADWLKPSLTPARLQEMVEREIRETCEAAELEEMAYPDHWEVDGNSSTLEDLKELRAYPSARNSGWLGAQKAEVSINGDLVKAIADEFTADQFRKWLCIQFMPNPEAQDDLDIDAFFDFWMALAEVHGEFKIGYFELEDPD
jgi:hypothetical protein